MSSPTIFQRCVLKLNRKHRKIGFFTPQEVFTALANWEMTPRGKFILDRNGKPVRKMLAYDVEYFQRDDDTYDFDRPIFMRMVDWDVWITLPIRAYDSVIHTPNLKIRIPKIVMDLSCEKMPETKWNNSLNSYYKLYKRRCAYTNQELKKEEASRDHIIPKNKGGTDDPSNIVLCHKNINSIKGDKYNYECGLPEVKPIIPKPRPLEDVLENDKNEPEWYWILGKKP